jgi:hypothetical protein
MGESAWSDWKSQYEAQEARYLYAGGKVAPGTAKIILAASVHHSRWVERSRTAFAFLQEQFDQGLINASF